VVEYEDEGRCEDEYEYEELDEELVVDEEEVDIFRNRIRETDIGDAPHSTGRGGVRNITTLSSTGGDGAGQEESLDNDQED